jgi:hypothetical protein
MNIKHIGVMVLMVMIGSIGIPKRYNTKPSAVQIIAYTKNINRPMPIVLNTVVKNFFQTLFIITSLV